MADIITTINRIASTPLYRNVYQERDGSKQWLGFRKFLSRAQADKWARSDTKAVRVFVIKVTPKQRGLLIEANLEDFE